MISERDLNKVNIILNRFKHEVVLNKGTSEELIVDLKLTGLTSLVDLFIISMKLNEISKKEAVKNSDNKLKSENILSKLGKDDLNSLFNSFEEMVLAGNPVLNKEQASALITSNLPEFMEGFNELINKAFNSINETQKKKLVKEVNQVLKND